MRAPGPRTGQSRAPRNGWKGRSVRRGADRSDACAAVRPAPPGARRRSAPPGRAGRRGRRWPLLRACTALSSRCPRLGRGTSATRPTSSRRRSRSPSASRSACQRPTVASRRTWSRVAIAATPRVRRPNARGSSRGQQQPRVAAPPALVDGDEALFHPGVSATRAASSRSTRSAASSRSAVTARSCGLGFGHPLLGNRAFELQLAQVVEDRAGLWPRAGRLPAAGCECARPPARPAHLRLVGRRSGPCAIARAATSHHRRSSHPAPSRIRPQL